MKKNPMPLLLLTVALTLAFGLLFTGCGLNQAKTLDEMKTPDTTAVSTPLDDRAVALQAELEAALEADRQALAQREAELAAREAQVAAQLAQARAEAEAAAAQPVVVTIPSLTRLEIDLADAISSETNLAGDPVTATLAQDVVIDNRVALPAGSELQGVIAQAVPTRSFGGQAQLEISFDRLIATDGRTLPIAAVLDLTGQRQKKKDAATIGGSAAGGAVLGRILNDKDRDAGTAVGAAVGAAIGAIVAANNKVDPVEVPAGTPLVLTLDAAVTLELDA